MLIVTEGVSKSGKSTVLQEIEKRRSDVVITKGSGIDQELEWSEHVLQNIKQCGQVYKQNPDTTFIHDRFFSEAVYGEDEELRRRVLRSAQCFKELKVVYFTANKETLQARGSKDLWRLEELEERYEMLRQATDSHVLDTGMMSEIEAVQRLESIVGLEAPSVHA